MRVVASPEPFKGAVSAKGAGPDIGKRSDGAGSKPKPLQTSAGWCGEHDEKRCVFSLP